MNIGLYVLDGRHRPVPAKDIYEWGQQDRRVALTKVGSYYEVSTVFLGIDHGFGSTPMWFETMVFGPEGAQSDMQWRYTTWEEALLGHEVAVTLVETVSTSNI